MQITLYTCGNMCTNMLSLAIAYHQQYQQQYAMGQKLVLPWAQVKSEAHSVEIPLKHGARGEELLLVSELRLNLPLSGSSEEIDASEERYLHGLQF